MNMLKISRRQFVQSLAATSITTSQFCNRAINAAERKDKNKRKIRLGFSLYGMRKLKTNEALRTCASIGYKSVELVATAGWPCDPKLLTAIERRDLSKQIEDSGLHLSSLMENLHVVVDANKRKQNLDRLKAACDLAHDLAPQDPPLIETVLGGRASQWESLKSQLASGLGEWAKVVEQQKVMLAIKAHVGGALHRPNDAVWLVKEVGSDWVKLNYDFSHFQLYDFDLEKSLNTMLDHTVFIHAKDTKGKAGNFQFLLPGEGNIDYRKYSNILHQRNYSGSVMVEVSGQIHGRPGYDPITAAKTGYQNLARYFGSASLNSGR